MSLPQLLKSFPLVESPWFSSLVETIEDPYVREMAIDLHRDGFAVVDFPEVSLDKYAHDLRQNLEGHLDIAPWLNGADAPRVQDAWKFDENVRALATNETMRLWLSQIYGREAFPFQTLNFRVGSEQSLHTDAVHFSSCPERFMCGVWLALEDITEDNGPLFYYPGSHRLPIYKSEHLHLDVFVKSGLYGSDGNYSKFDELWRELVAVHGLERRAFTARKGQAIIWLSNLIHGGLPQKNKQMTRWSQVTHYYFKDCFYYTPMLTNFFQDKVWLREPVNILTGEPEPNVLNGQRISLSPLRRHFEFQAKTIQRYLEARFRHA